MHMKSAMGWLTGEVVTRGRPIVSKPVMRMLMVVVMGVRMMVVSLRDIEGDCMNGDGARPMLIVSMCRRGRNHPEACEGKRQAEAHEAPKSRHIRSLSEGPCMFLKRTRF